MGSILAYTIIAAAYVVGSTTKSARTAVILAVPAIVLELIDLVLLRDDTQFLSHIFGMLFIGYVVFQLLKTVFASKSVTADTIFASLCAYLLLATIWMFAYSLLELFDPNAFHYSLLENPETEDASGTPHAPQNQRPSIMRLGAEPAGLELYYSFVTMTTLGYGDIVPRSPAARSLATLQAVVGQLYLAVLVARLVGMHVAESARRRE